MASFVELCLISLYYLCGFISIKYEVTDTKPVHTRRNLATWGLKVGVLMYWRKRVAILFLSPSRLLSFISLFRRSASCSVNATISLVSLQLCSYLQIPKQTFKIMHTLHFIKNIKSLLNNWPTLVYFLSFGLETKGNILKRLAKVFSKPPWWS